jgi:hypothetical protein
VWSAVQSAARDALSSDPVRAQQALELLTPHVQGLVPDALLALSECLPADLARALAEGLRERLSVWASAEQPLGLRLRALELLVRGGAPDDPSVLRLLEHPEDPAFGGVVETLAAHALAPAAMRLPLLRAFDTQASWVKRMHIAQVVGAELGAERLEREPIELVRLAAQARARRVTPPACSAPPSAN